MNVFIILYIPPQLRHMSFFFDSVIADWTDGPSGMNIIEQFVGIATLVVAVLMAAFMLVPLKTPTTLGTLRKERENLRRGTLVKSTLPSSGWIPIVQWWRRQLDIIKTYECEEQQDRYTYYLSFRNVSDLGTVYFTLSWVHRFMSSTPDTRQEWTPTNARDFLQRLILTCCCYFYTFVGHQWRRPKNVHSRPGQCCPRQPTKHTVAAWRHQWLITLRSATRQQYSAGNIGGKLMQRRKRSISPGWKPKIFPETMVAEKRIRSTSVGRREKKTFEWTVRRMPKIPIWWPFYSTLRRHIYRRDLIWNTFECKYQASWYNWQSTASILLWISMNVYIILYIIPQLRHMSFFFDSVIPDWTDGPFRMNINEQFIDIASLVLMAAFMLVPLKTPITLTTLRREREHRLKKALLKSGFDSFWWIPIVNQWWRRERDIIETYGCNEQRGHYEEFFSGRVGTVLFASSIIPLWMSRLVPDIYHFIHENTGLPEGVVPPFTWIDWCMFALTCFTIIIWCAIIPVRRPKNVHARPGKCCPRQPTKYTVAAWRYQWLKITTNQ
ncbi:unnamed protein product, partial [Mesorhabditis spiculigera]